VYFYFFLKLIVRVLILCRAGNSTCTDIPLKVNSNTKSRETNFTPNLHDKNPHYLLFIDRRQVKRFIYSLCKRLG
jgi:hypothetical protein